MSTTTNLGVTKLEVGQAQKEVTINEAFDAFDAAIGPSPRYRASVTHNANQSIANNAVTAVAFNTETFDNHTLHDTVTNNSRLTLNKVGLWWVWGTVTWDGNGTGIRVAQIRLNGDNSQRYGANGGPTTASGNVSTEVGALVTVASITEYAELVVFQTSGAGLNVITQTAFSPRFGCVWLGS